METITEKKLLKVGDKVYRHEYSRWHSLNGYYNYISATVERLTKTHRLSYLMGLS